MFYLYFYIPWVKIYVVKSHLGQKYTDIYVRYKREFIIVTTEIDRVNSNEILSVLTFTMALFINDVKVLEGGGIKDFLTTVRERVWQRE